MRDADVVIVGSGPAGMSAAGHLEGSGLEVVVIERLSSEAFRRYHSICGEAVSRRMLKLSGTEPPVVAEVSTLRLSGPGIGIDIGVEGAIVDRPSMLESMRSASSATLVRATVSSVAETDGGFEVSAGGEVYRCRYLIGADGAHSIVRGSVFGTGPEEQVPVVTEVVPGDFRGILGFEIGGGLGGAYTWRFSSSPGYECRGGVRGMYSPEGVALGRHIPIGRVPEVVRGNAVLIGDAACLANPLSFGGIGAALLSGRKAAEAVKAGDLRSYARWVERSRMFDRRFMDVHVAFSRMDDEEIADAMYPFRRGYSLARGVAAMIRRPRLAGMYMGCWLGFRYGW